VRNRSAVVLCAVFVLGIAAGAFGAKKFDPSIYRGKSKKEAAAALLELARKQAGKGSWERIGVARAYYLGGLKSEGQAIFDEITAKKPEASDWWRIGRVYWEANEWDKARAAFEKSLSMNPKDDRGWVELGSYYLIKGDRTKAEELFDKAFDLEANNEWNSAMAGGAYLGVKPQTE
jgi:tetratricopeptide (TPR) repeat protein